MESGMIKRLRRKFILIAVVSVFCVLSIIIAAVNIVNYSKIATFADNVLDLLYENGGRFPMSPNHEPPDFTQDDRHDQPFKPSHGMSEETPYETRFFTVRFDGGGEPKTEMGNIAAISAAQAIELAQEAIESGDERGYSGVYRYLAADGGNSVIFVDCSRLKDTANDFLKASLIISGIGITAVFVLVLIFSKYAVKPIAESYEKQKRFITDASHELKTPLTVISANNELTELTTGETQATQSISKQVARMTAMVKNMTALLRLDEEPVEKAVFSLSDAVTDTAESFRPSLENGQRTFDSDIKSGLNVNGDETQIRQALSAVFENAAKYASNKTCVNLYAAGKNAEILLSNDAECVPQGNLDRCFERFYRTDEARASAVSGNGIGLSVAKEAVERSGGKISAFGSSDGIFEIKIVFPLAK